MAHDELDNAAVSIEDPHAFPYPEGPVWDRLGHELVYGRSPGEVAAEYGEPEEAVRALSDTFWGGYYRSCLLGEAEEYGLLEELALLPNRDLRDRLVLERSSRCR